MSIKPLTDTLRRIGKGAFMDQASAELAKLVRQVEETGKPGALVLAIRISKANRGGALVVEGKHELKLPKAPPEDALMWATTEGNLVDRDPAQPELPLSVVPADTAAKSTVRQA